MKTNKILLFLFCFGMGTGLVRAQTIKTYPDVWFLSLTQMELGSKWRAGLELHHRRTFWVNERLQSLVRPFMEYKAAPGLNLAVGYSFILSHPFDPALPYDRPEHNFWEQATLSHQIGKFKIYHRNRLEHRFSGVMTQTVEGNYVVERHTFSNRFRYRLIVRLDLSAKWFLIAFDELWVNFNGKMQLTSFDRNWMFGAVGYKFWSEKGNVQLGYLHQWIQTSPSTFERHPTVQLVFQYDI
ncbi:MAG: DUF2490 domain-containing protein [Bacteroidia bacterium]|nr:DUF2490 domain-containing protein [Bacteroidia bacterium]